MAIILRNCLLADIAPLNVEACDLRIDSGLITHRGTLTAAPGDEILDCHGALGLPGLVNGHTHLYSALAVGMPQPPRSPRNFMEILEMIWWRLDCALDPEMIEASATIGAIDALRAGTTTLIDHHASPNSIEHSLDNLETGLAKVGVRGVLCYEITDRHGDPGRDKGLQESERYALKCSQRRDGRYAALIGAHASFTLSDYSLREIVRLAERFSVGVHIHVAEDPCDEETCRKQNNCSLIERLDRHGLLRANSIFAHGTHLDAEAISRVNAAGLTVAHNARSNMNNCVGYAPINKLRTPLTLGTDGIGEDMIAEAQHAWFISRHNNIGFAPSDFTHMLASTAARASASVGVTLGKLQPGAAADIVITRYLPFTPVTAGNLPAHIIFALSSRDVEHVLVGGEWAMRGRVLQHCEESAAKQAAKRITQRLWKALA